MQLWRLCYDSVHVSLKFTLLSPNMILNDIILRSLCKKSRTWIIRNFSNFSVTNKKNSANAINFKVSQDVIDYFDSHEELRCVKDLLAPHLLREAKTSDHYYLASMSTARKVASLIGERLRTSPIVIEANAGCCVLTKSLLEADIQKIRIFDCSPYHSNQIEKLQGEYGDRVQYFRTDFFAMGKIAYQDNNNSTTQVPDMLTEIKAIPWGKDHSMSVVGPLNTLNFINFIIKSMVYNNTLMTLGRPDFYFFMPPSKFKFLIGASQKNNRFRSVSSHFQLLCDHEMLAKLPKKHFVPWIKDPTDEDSEYVYVVNIKPKEILPCPQEYLPLLRFFFTQQFMSNNLRVIPVLERWIPGCGVWIITGQDPRGSNSATLPNESDAPLPKMTIFTLFGELNLRQKLTIFKKFVSWPEFELCPFRSTMESNVSDGVALTNVDMI